MHHQLGYNSKHSDQLLDDVASPNKDSPFHYQFAQQHRLSTSYRVRSTIPHGTDIDKLKVLMLDFQTIVMMRSFESHANDEKYKIQHKIAASLVHPGLLGVAGSATGLNRSIPATYFARWPKRY